MKQQLLNFLESLRPSLQQDGGDLEFISFDQKKKVLTLRLTGVCSHCAIAPQTFEHYIKREILNKFPAIKTIKNT